MPHCLFVLGAVYLIIYLKCVNRLKTDIKHLNVSKENTPVTIIANCSLVLENAMFYLIVW